MRNVLHVIDTSGPGGAETVFVELATGLNPDTWGAVAAIPEDGWVADQLSARGVRPAYTPLGGRGFDLGYLRALVRLVRRHRVDLIQTHLLAPSVYGCLAGALTRVPVVCTFHGEWDIAGRGRLLGMKLAILRYCSSGIVYVSESLRKVFATKGGLSAPQTTVIENGVRLEPSPVSREEVRAELGVMADDFLVGVVGNVRPAKAYDVLLRAAAFLRRRSSRYRFVIIGDTTSPLFEELDALRTSLGLADAVRFLGFRSDVRRLMRAIDVYVISSSSEGFSLSTVEAMASTVPVVATRCGGPEEILQDGETGVLVDVGSPSGLAEAVERVAGDPARARQLARAGRDAAVERFGLPRMLASYDALYARTLS